MTVLFRFDIFDSEVMAQSPRTEPRADTSGVTRTQLKMAMREKEIKYNKSPR
jgi:hypothetical protein